MLPNYSLGMNIRKCPTFFKWSKNFLTWLIKYKNNLARVKSLVYIEIFSYHFFSIIEVDASAP